MVHAPAEVHIVMIDVVVHDVVGLVANYLPARVMARSCFHQILHHVTKVLVVRRVSGAAAVLNEHYQLTQMMCGYIENACVADKWTPAPNLAQAIISHLHQKKVSYYQLSARSHLPGCLSYPFFLVVVLL